MGTGLMTPPQFERAAHDSQAKAGTRSPAWLRAAAARLQAWLRIPRELPGSPFVAARRRLVLTNVLVMALVLAVVSGLVYFLSAQNTQQNTITLVRYYATHGGQIAAENSGLPAGDGNEGVEGGESTPPPRLVPYSPSSPDVFSVVLTSSGAVHFDSDQVIKLGVPVATAAQPVLHGKQASVAPVVEAAGHEFQLYVTGVQEHGQLEWVVVAGTSLDAQHQQLEDLTRTLVIVYAVVLLMTLLTSVFLTERGLEPARLAFARQRQFATAASHELKTPLAVMRSEVELANGLVSDSLALLDSGEADVALVRQQLEEARGEANAATAEVDFMARLVQDLLLLARDASDQLAHSWAAVDVRALADDVTARMRPIAEGDDLTLHANVSRPGDGGPLWVRGDAGLLRQLLYGLLENAVRYTPSGGSIWVEVREEGRAHLLGDHRRRAVIEVRDTGIGIAPQHLASIFEPFYRAVSTTRPLHGEQHGTGLGLAMAQWIVRAHGGTIGVRSVEGKGTTFTVELPRAHPDDVGMVIEDEPVDDAVDVSEDVQA